MGNTAGANKYNKQYIKKWGVTLAQYFMCCNEQDVDVNLNSNIQTHLLNLPSFFSFSSSPLSPSCFCYKLMASLKHDFLLFSWFPRCQQRMAWSCHSCLLWSLNKDKLHVFTYLSVAYIFFPWVRRNDGTLCCCGLLETESADGAYEWPTKTFLLLWFLWWRLGWHRMVRLLALAAGTI